MTTGQIAHLLAVNEAEVAGQLLLQLILLVILLQAAAKLEVISDTEREAHSSPLLFLNFGLCLYYCHVWLSKEHVRFEVLADYNLSLLSPTLFHAARLVIEVPSCESQYQYSEQHVVNVAVLIYELFLDELDDVAREYV